MRKSAYCAAALVVAASSVSFGQTVTNLLTDNFDDGQGATRWDFQARENGLDSTIAGNVPDANVVFNYNYSAVTYKNFDPATFTSPATFSTPLIGAAPRGGGMTGVQIHVNDNYGSLAPTNAIAQAAILPKAANITGDYRMIVDVFADNAPYPNGSTETTMIGLNYDGTGVVGDNLPSSATAPTAIPSNGSANGYAFANSTDGDLAGDYRVYTRNIQVDGANDDSYSFAKRNATWTGTPGLVPYIDQATGNWLGSNTNAQEAFNPYYWDLTDGIPNGPGHDGGVGKSWNTVQMIQRGNIVTYQIDGKIINTLFLPTVSATATNKVSLGAYDPSPSTPGDVTESFYIYDNAQIDALSSMPTNTILASDNYAKFNAPTATADGAFTMNGLEFQGAGSTVGGTGVITLGTARSVATASGAIYADGGTATTAVTHNMNKAIAINASTAMYADQYTTLKLNNVQYTNTQAVISKAGRGTVVLGGNIHALAIQINSGTLSVPAGNHKINYLNLNYQSATTTADTGRLDMGKSLFAVDYTVLPVAAGVTGTQSPFAAIAAYINAGYAADTNGNPQFNGPGIVTSAPELQGASYATSNLTIRAIEASDLGYTGTATLGSSGLTIDGTTVLFGVSFKADLNFDHSVNFADLVILAQNYNGTGKTFYQGNANGDVDGNVNFTDLVLLAQSYNQTLNNGVVSLIGDPNSFAADWALAQSIAPEPASLSLLGLAAGVMVRRRRR